MKCHSRWFQILASLGVIGGTSLLGASVGAVPESGNVSRFGASALTFQEPLRLQSPSGGVDISVANYKGAMISYERQKRQKGGGYAVAFAVGGGSASGGGTSDTVSYKLGDVSWTALQIQPRAIWAVSEQIDIAASVAASYRLADWAATDTIQVTPSRALNAIFLIEVDCMLTDKLAFRQSFGSGSLDAGLYMRWGLSYDL